MYIVHVANLGDIVLHCFSVMNDAVNGGWSGLYVVCSRLSILQV